MRQEFVVMVVDSKEQNLQTMCDVLNRQGITRLLCVSSGFDALEYLSYDFEIDMLIIAEELEDIKGSDVVRRIRTDRSNLMCVLCEDTDRLTAGLEAKVAGAIDFVRKKGFCENLNEVLPCIIRRLELVREI